MFKKGYNPFRKVDLTIFCGLLLHVFTGWLIYKSDVSVVWLLISTLVVVGSLVIRFATPNAWDRVEPYIRYVYLFSMVLFTLYYWELNHPVTFVLMHILVVLILSALYLQPRLIWFLFACYLPVLVMVNYSFDNPHYPLLIVPIAVILLHLICKISLNRITLIRTIEREQSFERLGQHHHLATIGQIAASIAHDIRNPLTSISGFVQLMEKSEKREYYLEYYQIIRSEITRIDSLLREVLALSKSHTIESEVLQPVHLGNLLSRILLLLEPEALRAKIEFMINVKGNPIVEASEEKLHQVFLNLLRNAVEAIEQEGIVDICVSEQNGEAIVAIRDSGPGIAEDQLDHLFIPFFTTKSEGTGLGLSICQSIIRSYGGTIEVHNLPNRGAEFIIMLPTN